MTDLTIKPEEIVEGEEYTLTVRGVAGHADIGGRYFSAGGQSAWVSATTLAAATITRHEREPQVGDVGRIGDDDAEWSVEAIVKNSLGLPLLLLWHPEHRSNSVGPKFFTVTKRAGQ